MFMKDERNRHERDQPSGVAWVGKAALFCLALLAILALVIVTTTLTAVMLMTTAQSATVMWQKRDLRRRQNSMNISEFSAPRKAVAS